MRTLNSNTITFMDTTDTKRLDLYIASNLPTSQIYNTNQNTYTPDWTSTNLVLTPTVYVDSTDITNNVATFSWSRQIGNDSPEVISNNKNLTIATNELGGSVGIISYICSATYDNKTATNQITFTRTDTGAKGEDGTSVTILGVAYTTSELIAGNIVYLYSDENCITPINTDRLVSGDSYIVNGYLCVYGDEDKNFICTGQIQGPKGEDAKSIALSANNHVFKIDKGGAISPSTITITAQTFNTTVSSWSYSIDGGQTFMPSAVGVSQSGEQVTITGSDITSNAITIKASDGVRNDYFTIYKVSDGTDGNDGVPAATVFLSNENITFAANENGQVDETMMFFNVVAYNGTTKITPTIATITGAPDGMSINMDKVTEVSNELMIQIDVNDGATFGSDASASGTITIPVISPIATNLKLNWSKINTGLTGTDGITFQIYAPDGLLLSKDIPYLTLRTFAYDGSNPISTDATYVWSRQENSEWVIIDEQNESELIVTKDDVLKSKSYQCTMEYNNHTYYATATIQDKSDIYNAVACVASNACSTDGEYYWILYTLIYSENNEIDPLLGTISQVAPDSPSENDYWYAVDTHAMTVTLKKYDGSAWINSVDTQELSYNWSIIGESGSGTLLDGTSKVKLITSHDFTSTSTFMCNVHSATDGVLAQTTLNLTDVSDPIMSEEEPLNPSNGQIWIKPNDNGSFLLFVWDATDETWVMADADTRSRVYTSRPSSYTEGDLWITASNEDHGSYLQGTLLQAQASSSEYSADDWSPSLRYDKDLEGIQNQLNDLHQYITMSSEGLRIRAKNESGETSPYNSLFTSTKLAFCDGDTELLIVGKDDDNLDGPSKVIAPEIEVKNELTVGNSFNLGNLKLIIEDNGSFSFTVER